MMITTITIHTQCTNNDYNNTIHTQCTNDECNNNNTCTMHKCWLQTKSDGEKDEFSKHCCMPVNFLIVFVIIGHYDRFDTYIHSYIHKNQANYIVGYVDYMNWKVNHQN